MFTLAGFLEKLDGFDVILLDALSIDVHGSQESARQSFSAVTSFLEKLGRLEVILFDAFPLFVHEAQFSATRGDSSFAGFLEEIDRFEIILFRLGMSHYGQHQTKHYKPPPQFHKGAS
jgi:hypothetical protein